MIYLLLSLIHIVFSVKKKFYFTIRIFLETLPINAPSSSKLISVELCPLHLSNNRAAMEAALYHFRHEGDSCLCP